MTDIDTSTILFRPTHRFIEPPSQYGYYVH